jgi:hypothetical protein
VNAALALALTTFREIHTGCFHSTIATRWNILIQTESDAYYLGQHAVFMPPSKYLHLDAVDIE